MATPWIQNAVKHKGALRKELHVGKGRTIPKGALASAAKRPGVTGRRARLAETLGRMSKKGRR